MRSPAGRARGSRGPGGSRQGAPVTGSPEPPDCRSRPAEPGVGCLFVHVPPSAQAPHMVDHIYYGRSDCGKMRLDDEDVRRIIERRRRGRLDMVAELRQMADDDPIGSDERQPGHLYLLAQPQVAPEEMLLDLLVRRDAMQVIIQILEQIRRDRGSATNGFAPDTDYLRHRIPRAEGTALASYSAEDGPNSEVSLLELVVREDGGIRLICGRGTDALR